MDIFKLYRVFWNWCFENPSKIKPTHIAIYSFAIEHCNRLGWKREFGLPTSMVMEAIGVRSYNTYIKAFRELVDFGFIELIEISKNQYSSNIIALSNFDNAPYKALDKALIKHTSKQVQSTRQSTRQSTSSITIQDTINNKQDTKRVVEKLKIGSEWEDVVIDWLQYKKERKESYKSERSVKAFVSRLKKLSGDNVAVAKKITEVSMGQNWAGIFELKGGNNEKNRTDSETARREQQIFELAREAGMAE